jgi:DNA mismatch repair protein MutS
VNPPLSFHSILFDGPENMDGPGNPDEPGNEPGNPDEPGHLDGPGNGPVLESRPPAFFTDLNLDQVVQAITAGRDEYDLAPFFYTRLGSTRAIGYRHEALQDLRDPRLLDAIGAFARGLRTMHGHLAQAAKLHYRLQRQNWFLHAVVIYCDAVTALVRDLTETEPESRGFRAFRDYLAGYVTSGAFMALRAETDDLTDRLAGIRYCLQIHDSRVKVTRYDGEADYTADVAATFRRFQQGAAQSYLLRFHNLPDMNHVEAGILDLVAQLYPDIFAALNDYCDRHRGYLDPTVAAFDREVQFYVAYLEYIAPLERAGLAFCYPQVSAQSKDVMGREVFDLALADKLVGEQSPVVSNDFDLAGPERILVVSGPNQGGKTTFARTFGQLHFLASIGVPVPGRQARLFLFDRMFTHFERGENLQDLRGKLEDDLIRMHEVLGQATAASIVIMNEIFTSTTLQDAVFLGTRVLEQIIELDLLCVCVTFVDELASLGATTISMVSTVLPENPAERTYKIVRRPADGLAYAAAIAEKYGLTYGALRERIAR